MKIKAVRPQELTDVEGIFSCFECGPPISKFFRSIQSGRKQFISKLRRENMGRLIYLNSEEVRRIELAGSANFVQPRIPRKRVPPILINRPIRQSEVHFGTGRIG